MKKILQYVISLAVAAGLLWFVFKDIDLNTLWEKIKQADYRWVGLSAILALAAHWSRAYRWVLMLEPLGYKPSVFRTTLAVLVGYLANLVFPRAGEFARCGTLNKLEDIPFEKSFGAVVAERIADVLVLLVLILLNLFLEFDRLSTFFFNFFGNKFKNPVLLASIGTALVILVIMAYFTFKRNIDRISKLPLYQKISGFIGGLASGFLSVRNLKNPGAFVFHTVLIWTLYYITTYVLCFALPETANLSPLAALTIFVMGSIGMAAPTQGGIGSYHFLVGSIVVLYGLSEQDGITLATFLHAMQGLFFVVIFGVTAFLLTFILPKKKAQIV
ncbi:lysylphosphatidylglycerol synthase transmembrane domain-containing protein [Emticicia sp. 21SJ11W-3]|uniref:lysylphosphatidylglycerol synthase transmembrane domain-containing protein n=1 Tax=Emticicia sp. 21SJ11W-3 TaxID=2916755 RepID=UPI00209FE5AC|nr:lysylphosphatidylglycerol synthase transmembrane domain-containing protein [Emticicia sp. 21SJ11W-3]UTA69146.1 flippase-like domain-containing protein [Emticicia sp. 21SJ11W-3]